MLYWSKRVESERVGRRVARVECDKCRCEYFYELARIGSGHATAPYGIGKSGATLSAERQSQVDLTKRLAIEAELVPCPNCNWINDDLVQGFRRGRYRRFGAFAVGLGFCGAMCSLIAAWFISNGPAVDRAALPYVLIGGPILFLFLAVGLILIRIVLRSRIQPNRAFPLAPRLAPGSPPALLREQSSGELIPANPDHSFVDVTNTWHDFQIGRHTLPLLCCGCLGSASAEHAYKCPLATALELDIPRCRDCARRANRRFVRVWWTTAGLGVLVECAAVLPLTLQLDVFWIIVVCSIPILLAFASFMASAARAPVEVVGGDGPRGVVRLRFRNADYGREVAKHLSDPNTAVTQNAGTVIS